MNKFKFFCLMLCGFWCVLRCPLFAIAQESAQFHPTNSVEKAFEQIPKRDKAKTAQEWASNGIFVHAPSFWKALTNPDSTLQGVYTLGEPIDPDALDALERLLPQFKDERLQIRAAALLYRYGRDVGRQLLLAKAIKSFNHTAAEILVLNHDKAILPIITKTLSLAPERELILALGQWQDAEVTKALFSVFRTNNWNIILALALAQHQDKEAIPLARKLYGKTKQEKGTSWLLAAAVLIRFKVSESKTLLKLLEDEMKKPEKEFSHAEVVAALGETSHPDATPVLKAIILSYLEHGTITIQADANGDIEQTANDTLAVDAVEALLKLDSTVAADSAEQLLSRLTDDKSDAELRSRVAKVLLLAQGVKSEGRIKKLTGEYWTKVEFFKHNLKPIPEYMLPKVMWEIDEHNQLKPVT